LVIDPLKVLRERIERGGLGDIPPEIHSIVKRVYPLWAFNDVEAISSKSYEENDPE
jgi:hypothetical protein